MVPANENVNQIWILHVSLHILEENNTSSFDFIEVKKS